MTRPQLRELRLQYRRGPQPAGRPHASQVQNNLSRRGLSTFRGEPPGKRTCEVTELGVAVLLRRAEQLDLDYAPRGEE